MSDLVIREIADDDIEAVVGLWTAAGLVRPWNDPSTDIAFARSSANATIRVGLEGGRIVASVMVGHDGHRGTVYYLAVDPSQRRAGLGRRMMAAAEEWLRELGVWKINLMVRAENHEVLGFYDALGYRDSGVVVREKWIDETKRFADKP